jgi:hypothetical protein
MDKLILGILYIGLFVIAINIVFGDLYFKERYVNYMEHMENKSQSKDKDTSKKEDKKTEDKEQFFGPSKSSAESVDSGASTYYGWGLKDDDKKKKKHKSKKKKCQSEEVDIEVKVDVETCPALVINGTCKESKIPQGCPVGKSCPDMSDYIKKSDIPPYPEMSDYIKKSDIPPCSVPPRPKPSKPVDQENCAKTKKEPKPAPQKCQKDKGLCPNGLDNKSKNCKKLIKERQGEYEENPYTYSIPNRYTFDLNSF